jgi:hypothetical protein
MCQFQLLLVYNVCNIDIKSIDDNMSLINIPIYIISYVMLVSE